MAPFYERSTFEVTTPTSTAPPSRTSFESEWDALEPLLEASTTPPGSPPNSPRLSISESDKDNQQPKVDKTFVPRVSEHSGLICEPYTSPLDMPATYAVRDGGDPKNKKQSMADLKLRRLNELNLRLKEDLERPRVKVAEASQS